jgi:hypothetical protein
MLRKLTNGTRVLDEKMKKQIFGGASCANQCKDDCNNDEQIRKALDGDAEGKKVVPIT